MTAQAGGAIPSSQVALATDRSALRQQLRRIRRSLSSSEQRNAAAAVARRLARHPLCKPGARIGIYLAMPGELCLQPFVEQAWARGCRLFAPHITHTRRGLMAFYPYTPSSPLKTNQWGIPQLREPRRYPIAAITLDVVLVPVVGFDAQGNRLGMGAGFYDRHFARLRRSAQWRRPHLIGVAYACQQVPSLPIQPHDVGLEMIVTERATLRARPR